MDGATYALDRCTTRRFMLAHLPFQLLRSSSNGFAQIPIFLCIDQKKIAETDRAPTKYQQPHEERQERKQNEEE